MNTNENSNTSYPGIPSSSARVAVAAQSAADVIGQFCWLCIFAAGLVGHQLATAGTVYPVRLANSALLTEPGMPVPRTALHQPTVARDGAGAQFGQEPASNDVHQIANWIVDSHDNQGLPFLVVDKKNAKVFAFDPAGTLKGASPVLLGMAAGDESAPGIGQKKLSAIRPDQRTTPAGRFVAALARNLHGTEILWVDYDAAISLHRIVTGSPGERRAERLSSTTTTDNRISYGCINVPVAFYDQFVSPAFKGTDGIVYVLPEIRTPHEIFGSFDLDRRVQPSSTVSVVSAQITPTMGAAIRLR